MPSRRTLASLMMIELVSMSARSVPVVPTRTKVSQPRRARSVKMMSSEGAPMPVETAPMRTPSNVPAAARNPRGSAITRASDHWLAIRSTRSGSPGSST